MDTVGVLGVAGLDDACTGSNRFTAESGVASGSNATDDDGVRRPRARASDGTMAGNRFLGAVSAGVVSCRACNTRGWGACTGARRLAGLRSRWKE